MRGGTGPDSGVRTQRRTLERRTLGPNTLWVLGARRPNRCATMARAYETNPLLYHTQRAPYAACTLSACVPCKKWRLGRLLGGSLQGAGAVSPSQSAPSHGAAAEAGAPPTQALLPLQPCVPARGTRGVGRSRGVVSSSGRAYGPSESQRAVRSLRGARPAEHPNRSAPAAEGAKEARGCSAFSPLS